MNISSNSFDVLIKNQECFSFSNDRQFYALCLYVLLKCLISIRYIYFYVYFYKEGGYLSLLNM